MIVDVTVPQYGVAMEEAVLLEWSVSIGDHVDEGATIAVLETDKATVDLPAPVAGVVVELLVEPDDDVPVGGVVARINAEDGEG